ncbi:MAG: hypothetical protein AB1716_04180 [Planctomycetota bacterium]
MSRHESFAVGNIIQDLTRGQPYVFVVMAWKASFDLYNRIKAIVEREVGLVCVRADHIPAAGHDLLAKIHLLIDRAELVIAEITDRSPNVFYEVGYAVGAQKPLLLLIQKGRPVPTDLKGRELIEYSESREGIELLDRSLSEHVRLRINSHVPALRDMLQAEDPHPAYIVASPRYPQATRSRILGQVYDRRTFGDNLGILGLISAFGVMGGESASVELISAQYGPPDLCERDVNLYLIGSGKVNPTAGSMLEQLQGDRQPRWRLGPAPGEPPTGDYAVALYRGQQEITGCKEARGPDDGIVHVVDHGIIVRGPHPRHPKRLVLIMAGAHSLGTGAACLAATRSMLIQRINAALPGGLSLGDRDRAIWALVRGEASSEDGLLDVNGVSVLEAGVYD